MQNYVISNNTQLYDVEKPLGILEVMYQTRGRVFHHLEVSLKQKLGCASFFQPLLGVWISNETPFRMLDLAS